MLLIILECSQFCLGCGLKGIQTSNSLMIAQDPNCHMFPLKRIVMWLIILSSSYKKKKKRVKTAKHSLIPNKLQKCVHTPDCKVIISSWVFWTEYVDQEFLDSNNHCSNCAMCCLYSSCTLLRLST